MGERARTLSEDDESLLAMDASGMRMASIAATMGWSERRVVARLAKLAALREQAGAEGVALVRADVTVPVPGALLFWLSALAAALPHLAAIVAARGLVRVSEAVPVMASVLAVQGMSRVVTALPAMAAASRAVVPPVVTPSTIAPSLRSGGDGPPPPRGEELAALPTGRGGIVRWTAEEDIILREALADGRRDPIGRTVRASGRSEDAVRARMQKLGLRVSGAPAPVPTLDEPPRAVRGAPRRAMRAVGERAGVETLRTLTPARLRYAGWFHQAGWHVEEVADLFDLPVGDLAQALGVMQ